MLLSTPCRKFGGKSVAGVLFLVSMIVAETCGYPNISKREADYKAGLRVIMEGLKRQGLAGRMVPRAIFGATDVVIRKSVSPGDFRLRFGKRRAKRLPELTLEPVGNPHRKRQGALTSHVSMERKGDVS